MDTSSADRREELLDLVTDYVLRHGVSDLSLRPLAAAVGSSPRVLLYYFGSKEELIAATIDRLRDRQRIAFTSLPSNPETYRDAFRAAWAVLSAPKNEPLFRLFIELYGLALQDRKHYARFLHSAVEDWLSYLEQPKLREGYSPEAARTIATVILAGYRGFLLDFCATRDRDRLDRAVELWITALDAIPEPPGAS